MVMYRIRPCTVDCGCRLRSIKTRGGSARGTDGGGGGGAPCGQQGRRECGAYCRQSASAREEKRRGGARRRACTACGPVAAGRRAERLLLRLLPVRDLVQRPRGPRRHVLPEHRGQEHLGRLRVRRVRVRRVPGVLRPAGGTSSSRPRGWGRERGAGAGVGRAATLTPADDDGTPAGVLLSAVSGLVSRVCPCHTADSLRCPGRPAASVAVGTDAP